ncbi:MAG: hypothetical protein V1794_06725 [Candidatus Glassbacteria bacterium]
MNRSRLFFLLILFSVSLACGSDKIEGPYPTGNNYMNILLSANLDFSTPWTPDQNALASGISKCDTAYAIVSSQVNITTPGYGNYLNKDQRMAYRTNHGEPIDPSNWEGVVINPDGSRALYRAFESAEKLQAWHETKGPDCY